jgi:hypothetical protein
MRKRSTATVRKVPVSRVSSVTAGSPTIQGKTITPGTTDAGPRPPTVSAQIRGVSS